MPDMLVKLYALDPLPLAQAQYSLPGVTIRKPIPPEKGVVQDWIARHFGPGWACEFEAGMLSNPPHVFIALVEGKLVGFACHNATAPGFFGPTGVEETHRGKGVGKALLLACLNEMKMMGYGYAIIGGAGPTEFYEKACAAEAIEGSVPGVYGGMLDPSKPA